MKVILISGHAGSGKDTAAMLMKMGLEDRKKRVLICHYADLVKHVCRSFFNWNGEKDELGRSLLQYVGTDVVRARNPDYWVDFLLDMFRFFEHEWDFCIISDTRFTNEVTKMKSQFDAYHLRISRPNFKSKLTKQQQNHPSETELDSLEPDGWLINDGTIKDLQQKVNKILDTMEDSNHA